MRIGIDARFLTHPQRGGFKTYTENLISALMQIDGENNYVLYVDRVPSREIASPAGNFTYKVVRKWFPVMGMAVREQVLLPCSVHRDKLDVMHFTCNTASVMSPQKYVVTLHDVIQLDTSQSLNWSRGASAIRHWGVSAYSRWTIMRTARAAKGIITVSEYEQAQIGRRLGIEPERIHVTRLAPNAVFLPLRDQEKEERRRELRERFRIRDRFILGVGYEARKNIPLLVRAFAQIASDQPLTDLVIVAAETTAAGHLRDLADRHGIGDRVAILGALPPRDLAILYNLAELFVYPSERESFGLPPLEAMACGTPVIALKATSTPEILGDAALLTDSKDVSVWAGAIRRVTSDDELRSGLIARGRARAHGFSWEGCARETIEVYRAVADGE